MHERLSMPTQKILKKAAIFSLAGTILAGCTSQGGDNLATEKLSRPATYTPSADNPMVFSSMEIEKGKSFAGYLDVRIGGQADDRVAVRVATVYSCEDHKLTATRSFFTIHRKETQEIVIEPTTKEDVEHGQEFEGVYDKVFVPSNDLCLDNRLDEISNNQFQAGK